MVSAKTLRSYEFTSIEEYYNYILDSKINGQPQQATSLISGLSKQQKKQFLNWLDQFDNNADHVKFAKQNTIGRL